MKRKSIIFTNLELKLLDERMKGNKKDPYGLYANRIKPKVMAILEWIPRKKELEKLIKK